MAWLGDDPWDRPRRPQAHHQHSGGGYLDPRDPYQRVSGGIYRTRSQGHAPQPIVNVYNDVIQDANLRADPAVYPPSPDFRGRRISDRLGDEMLADELAELRLDRRLRSRSRTSAGRSHSRGRSGSGSSDFYKREYERLEREKQWKREQARIEAEAELKRQREEDDHKRVVSEYERKQREAADKAKLEEQRLLDKLEREKKEKKAEEERLKEKFEREEREAKEEEKRQWEEFERRQLEKKVKKEKEEKEEQARIDEAMRKRLVEAGLSGREIEAIMDKEKAKGKKTTTTTTTIRTGNALTLHGGHQPVYAKIHRDYLSVETLRYYSIPWEYDPSDDNYIIVLREMDKHETNILFDHTKALRAGRLLIEAPKNEKAYAFYRKRDRSKSRGRGDGEWKKFGILEYKK